MFLKSDNQDRAQLDWLRWLLAIILLLAGLSANYYYSEASLPLRLLGWFVALVFAGMIASRTQKGRWVVDFFRDSRLELRKVIWPTRQETMQTTLVVAAMVIILALILWGMDGILVWVVGWLTGQRG